MSDLTTVSNQLADAVQAAGAWTVRVQARRGPAASGIALAADLVLAAQLAETIGKHGKVPRGYLGVGSQPVTLSPQAKELTGGQERGLLVVQVVEGGPAASAGFLQGDILVKLDGAAVTNADDLQGLLGPHRVGTSVSASVVRGGELRDLSLTVGTRE